ncbi:hypothetical protein NDU88_005939 [Pleurodeles waltl]|uniref:Uncharacterized protein n=1 Tax=Pleurodeles waltl TaxID=8319 RepID=A0AAV7MXS0_PLEWA|nr:hypothetical protein NDU88_005939 [Pleurodeles waltl]
MFAVDPVQVSGARVLIRAPIQSLMAVPPPSHRGRHYRPLRAAPTGVRARSALHRRRTTRLAHCPGARAHTTSCACPPRLTGVSISFDRHSTKKVNTPGTTMQL